MLVSTARLGVGAFSIGDGVRASKRLCNLMTVLSGLSCAAVLAILLALGCFQVDCDGLGVFGGCGVMNLHVSKIACI